jgi:hypothetical protein
VDLTSEPIFISATLQQQITTWFGAPLIASLPAVTPGGDHATAFEALLTQIGRNETVLFPDVWPGSLDAFFHLRLTQVLRDQPPLRALSVVVLAPELSGAKLAGGFANRFRSAWPFERCVFVTESGDPASLSRQIGLPVHEADAIPEAGEVLRTGAKAGQKVALQLQMPWGRCGSTTAFENQIEDLVGAGFLTIRLFTNAHYRRGPTLRARLETVIPENSANAGAHINLVAVPDGPPRFVQTGDPEVEWASWIATTATCRIRDRAATEAAKRVETVIANHLDTIGAAIHFAPRARLLLDVHDDRVATTREWMLKHDHSDAETEAAVAAAEQAQALLLAIPDICTHVSTEELQRLGPQSQRSAIVLPRIYLPPAPTVLPSAGATRFDLLLIGDEHIFNIASLRWFLDEVWRPHLEPAGVRVAIAGRAGQRIDAAAYASPALHFLGYIDDLDRFRSWCRLTVIPDRGGTGVSIKMLSTLAAGHPLVTTSTGLRGLEASIAGMLPALDDPAAFAADILDLVRDPDRLAERQSLVRRTQDALRRGRDYVALLKAVPLPSAALLRRRQAGWATAVALATPADKAPWYFTLDTPFPLSGSSRDAAVLLDGWHEPEPWGRWTDGAEASLRIALAAPIDEPLRLQLEITPSAAGASLVVSVDGWQFDAIQPLPGPNGWDLPAELTAGKAHLVVTLQASETVCPARSGAVDDRILGIGVGSVRLVSRQPAVSEPGRSIPIRSDAVPRNLLLNGWHGVEVWGCWSNGRVASFQLTFAEALFGSQRLELNLTRPPAGGTLTLSVNDRALPAIEVRDGINRWNLPLEATNGQARLLIALSVSRTFCPAEDGVSKDDRTLGVGLRGVNLVAFVPAVAVVGCKLPLSPPVDLGEVLLDGWHPPESWGTWTNAPTATMRLSFAETLSGSFAIALEFAPRLVDAAVTVTVNGHELPPTAAAGVAAWSLPAVCTAGQRELLVTLSVPSTFCPADFAGLKDDRTLGIGVRSVTLRREAPATCPVGAMVAVSSRLGDTGMLVEGWHELEPWGCWSSGADAKLMLPFEAPLDGDHILEMNLRPPLLDPAFRMTVNGVELDAADVLDGLNHFVLPRRCTDGQSALSISIHVERPTRPADIRDSVDDRLLGVAVRGFAVHPLR